MKIVFGLSLIAAPDSALLVLNADVVGFYNSLTGRGPLWKMWTSHEPRVTTAIPATANSGPPEPFAPAA